MKRFVFVSLLVATSLTAFGSPALAQNSVPAQPLQGLDSFSLPSNRPAPRISPTPEPTTNPRPVETQTVAPPAVAPTVRTTTTPRATTTPARTTPTARATPAPERTPAPRASATPTPIIPAAPVAVSTVVPSPVATTTPTPAPTPQSSAAAAAAIAPADGASAWLWPAVGGGLALIVAIGLGLWWRRRGAQDVVAYEDETVAEPVAPAGVELAAVAPQAAPPAVPATSTVAEAPLPVAVVPDAAPADRASIVFELTPKRAGTNLLSAAVEYLIVLRNAGDVAATGVRLDIRLLSAGAQQDAVIEALFAAPIAQPITTPFDLPAGVSVELGGMAMHPKATLEVMDVGGKALFVPVLTINAHYAWAGGGSGQTARSYVIGIDRGAGGKLAPFRIDSAARMYDTVSAIEYTVSA
ncbi:hypothetical protein [Sphingomonas sp. 10B4]|uniref:hypothetical protein n=1 Tax=Sphingomonas sp. 10B4 TaxID=3048575 RepID=UPI002AB4EB23|nr:hypothetical protein [Sphingomonas sp. 10B4]MDY7523286.1 hypothetical protein [Sphingomonas sp. 10B4]MEB0283886.1 hypothetical protein [Sphingomonas sp. 10B4]